MKPFRTTIIFAVLLGALLAYLFLVDIKQEEEEQKREEQEKQLVLMERDDITRLTLSNAPAEPEPIYLEKGADGWRITQPIESTADQTVVDGIVSSLASLEMQEVVAPAPADLAPYGLARPLVTVQYGGASGPKHTILFGKTNPVNSVVYVKTADAPRVMVVPTSTKASLTKTLYDVRDKRIFIFTDSEVSGLAINPAGAPPLTFARKDNDWTMTAPHEWDASDDDIRSVLSALRGLRATSFADEVTAQAIDFENPDLGIELTLGEGDNLQRGALTNHDKSEYAARAGAPWVYQIAPGSIERIGTEPAEFREDKVIDFNRYTVRALTIEHAGGDSFTLTKEEGSTPAKWNLTVGARGQTGEQPESANQGAVTTLLTRLETMRSENFIDEPGDYGFDGDKAVTVSGVSPEGEELFRIILGAPHAGENQWRYVKAADKPQVFLLDTDASFNTAAADYRDTTPAPDPAAIQPDESTE